MHINWLEHWLARSPSVTMLYVERHQKKRLWPSVATEETVNCQIGAKILLRITDADVVRIEYLPKRIVQ
jgi:hypothetical protein